MLPLLASFRLFFILFYSPVARVCQHRANLRVNLLTAWRVRTREVVFIVVNALQSSAQLLLLSLPHINRRLKQAQCHSNHRLRHRLVDVPVLHHH